MAPSQREKASKSATKRTVCNADDFLILLDYLEIDSNFEKLFGPGRKTTAGGKYMSKEATWALAAAELKVLGFPHTTGKNLQKKWQRYVTKYREAKKICTQPGGGLTDEDAQAGITLEQKLNGICDHFHKMDELLGARINLNPRAQSGSMGFQNFGADPNVRALQNAKAVNISTLSPPRGVSDLQPPENERHPAWLQEELELLTEEQQTEQEEGQVETMQPGSEEDCRTPGQGGMEDTEQDGARITEEGGIVQEGGGMGSTETLQAAPNCTGSQGAATSAAAPSPVAPNAQPPKINKKSFNKIDQDNRKASSTSKTTLATTLQESKAQETEMKMKYIDKKDLWKMAGLKDKQEARSDDLKRKRLEWEFEAEQKRLERSETFLEAHRDRLHRKKLAKQKNMVDLIIAGWAHGKSQEEIMAMSKLVDN